MKRDYAQAAEGKREALVVNDESLKILVALQFLFCGGALAIRGIGLQVHIMQTITSLHSINLLLAYIQVKPPC